MKKTRNQRRLFTAFFSNISKPYIGARQTTLKSDQPTKQVFVFRSKKLNIASWAIIKFRAAVNFAKNCFMLSFHCCPSTFLMKHY